MSRYQADEFVQEEYTDDSINVNCVLSCHWQNPKQGQDYYKFRIDFHDGRIFDARAHSMRPSELKRVYQQICQNDGGNFKTRP